MEKLRIDEVVVVEGKYDKIKLQSVLDATIITTDGFGIFKDGEKQAFIRRMAAEKGIVALTDSDSAGMVIRNFLRGCVPGDRLRHAYVPQLAGKEKRKASASKEGLLGVEGMQPEVLREALERAGIAIGKTERNTEAISRTRFFSDGFIGSQDSAEKRKRLAKSLGLPVNLSSKALLEAINALCPEEYEKAVDSLAR